MPILKSVWGIDVGQCGLKAIKLREVEGELRVESLEIIEHEKILSQPDADRDQLVRGALEQFLSRHNLSNCTVAVAVPGQSSFTRFVKLPPVEGSRVPEIVRFEAEQQIPFSINDVHWRWQTFQDPDSPDVEVGIFAMKRVDVADALHYFSDVNLNVDIVQMAPLALYNFLRFDEQYAEDGATLLADIGADKTDLVVSDGARIWTRTIQIGGNNFTEALVRAFKLSFPKAEKLKRTAASSKYARQIFQAMRPVFADLVQEIQRSIGYYTSLHRETRFKRLVGLGNGFRLPGLQKFLEQNLNIPVVRVDNYNKLAPSPAVNEPTFTENVLSFAVAYGLALQGLELSAISTNLLPSEIARRRVWAVKRPWFVVAAGVMLVALCGPLYRSYADRAALAPSPAYQESQQVSLWLQELRKKDRELQGTGEKEKAEARKYVELFGFRDFWSEVVSLVSQSNNAVTQGDRGSAQELLRRYLETPIQDRAARKKILDELLIMYKNRKDRPIVAVWQVATEYRDNVNSDEAVTRLRELMRTPPGGGAEQPVGKGGAAKPGFLIVLKCRTTMDRSPDKAGVLMNKLADTSEKGVIGQIAGKMKTLRVERALSDFTEEREPPMTDLLGAAEAGVAPGAEVKKPDSLLPNEDKSQDTCFAVGWVVSIEGDGLGKLKE
jgi:type IV pilus assembly protein PilM